MLTRRSVLLASLAVVFTLGHAGSAAAQAADRAGSKDHPLFTRLPDYYINLYETSDFDAHAFRDGKARRSIEGRKTRIGYKIQVPAKAGGKALSGLAIRRNYTEAFQKTGGTVVVDETTGATMQRTKDGAEVWAEVRIVNRDEFILTIVEKGELKQQVTATDLLSTLEKDGRVTLYINFATGSATIQPDGQAVVDEIAGMLQKSPALSVSIEGHTDNVGGAPANQKLSQARAQAVVAALVAKGIGATRLSAAGFGQTAPIADNATEEGRAKNRRVELVKR